MYMTLFISTSLNINSFFSKATKQIINTNEYLKRKFIMLLITILHNQLLKQFPFAISAPTLGYIKPLVGKLLCAHKRFWGKYFITKQTNILKSLNSINCSEVSVTYCFLTAADL